MVADGWPDTRDASSSEPSIYLCGNSLGLQPRLTSTRLQQYLTTWATQGVFGHFKRLAESPLPTWLHGRLQVFLLALQWNELLFKLKSPLCFSGDWNPFHMR